MNRNNNPSQAPAIFFVVRFFPVAPRWRSLMRGEEARQQAQAERLTLLVADNGTGYFGVSLNNPGKPKPYQARVRRTP